MLHSGGFCYIDPLLRIYSLVDLTCRFEYRVRQKCGASNASDLTVSKTVYRSRPQAIRVTL